MSEPKFQLGQIVATPGALDAFPAAGEEPVTYLARHLVGDWGEVCEEDAQENDFSVKNGFRILSAYKLKGGTKIWVLTEADRIALAPRQPRTMGSYPGLRRRDPGQ